MQQINKNASLKNIGILLRGDYTNSRKTGGQANSSTGDILLTVCF